MEHAWSIPQGVRARMRSRRARNERARSKFNLLNSETDHRDVDVILHCFNG